MNERIEKLGEQADLLGEFTPTKIPGRYVGYITEDQILKFAELIVRECAENIRGNMNRHVSGAVRNTDYNLGLARAAESIEEQFGVK
jgi:hypothetical protein